MPHLTTVQDQVSTGEKRHLLPGKKKESFLRLEGPGPPHRMKLRSESPSLQTLARPPPRGAGIDGAGAGWRGGRSRVGAARGWVPRRTTPHHLPRRVGLRAQEGALARLPQPVTFQIAARRRRAPQPTLHKGGGGGPRSRPSGHTAHLSAPPQCSADLGPSLPSRRPFSPAPGGEGRGSPR